MISQASEIVESFREDIVAFHAAIGGRLVSLHTLLNTIGNSRSNSRFPLRLPITATDSLATCLACRHRRPTLPATGDVLTELITRTAISNNKPPMPPPAVAFLVELKKDQATGPEGPIVSEEQVRSSFLPLTTTPVSSTSLHHVTATSSTCRAKMREGGREGGR